MSASSIGPRLLGGVFGICAAFAIVLGLAVAILISPIIILVSAAIRHAAGSDGCRTPSSRSRPDRPHQMGPIIEGEYEVINVGEARLGADSKGDRSASAHRRESLVAAGSCS